MNFVNNSFLSLSNFIGCFDYTANEHINCESFSMTSCNFSYIVINTVFTISLITAPVLTLP
ncbi:hypothetical protein [Vaccinia virus]|nr:hypothetical protein [Vaccinia virus]